MKHAYYMQVHLLFFLQGRNCLNCFAHVSVAPFSRALIDLRTIGHHQCVLRFFCKLKSIAEFICKQKFSFLAGTAVLCSSDNQLVWVIVQRTHSCAHVLCWRVSVFFLPIEHVSCVFSRR
jgi:hypothetical protein